MVAVAKRTRVPSSMCISDYGAKSLAVYFCACDLALISSYVLFPKWVKVYRGMLFCNSVVLIGLYSFSWVSLVFILDSLFTLAAHPQRFLLLPHLVLRFYRAGVHTFKEMGHVGLEKKDCSDVVRWILSRTSAEGFSPFNWDIDVITNSRGIIFGCQDVFYWHISCKELLLLKEMFEWLNDKDTQTELSPSVCFRWKFPECSGSALLFTLMPRTKIESH